MTRLGVIFFILCLFLSSAHAGDKETTTITWQYIAKSFELVSDKVLTNQLNTLGADGWELVTCTEDNASLTCIFRKPGH